MDRSVALAKLDSLRRCLRRIESRRPATVSALLDDVDAQDVLCLNLERAVQLCVDLAAMRLADTDEPPPASMREAFLGLARQQLLPRDLAWRLSAAVTMRNILVHEYVRIDWGIVFSAVYQGLADFEDFARYLAACTSRPESEGIR